MNLGLTLALLVLGAPLWAQYAGPAILSRGQAPVNTAASAQISFRPFLEVAAIYDTGLAGVSLNQGQLGNAKAAGVELSAGIGGRHSWRHTAVGLDYKASLRHYNRKTYYDGTDQGLNLSLDHQFNRRIGLALRESAGVFNRDFGLAGLVQTVSFDPAASNIPRTDFFDNRTLYLSSQADLTYQRSARLSFNAGGEYFTAKRRSAALYGTTGQTVRGDVQYRVARYTTIGLNYQFTRYVFGKGFGDSFSHSLTLSYSVRITRNTEFSGYAGLVRLETKYVQVVPLDPVLAAILGTSGGLALIHNQTNDPTVAVRLARTFHNGVAFAGFARGVTPGNGLFLTSVSNQAQARYSYNGLKRWSLSAGAGYNYSDAVSNVIGSYKSYSGSLSASRRLTHSIHAVLNGDARKYGSSSFSLYNRVIYRASLGLTYSPGDLPLRVW